jgi:hypothetical protein
MSKDCFVAGACSERSAECRTNGERSRNPGFHSVPSGLQAFHGQCRRLRMTIPGERSETRNPGKNSWIPLRGNDRQEGSSRFCPGAEHPRSGQLAMTASGLLSLFQRNDEPGTAVSAAVLSAVRYGRLAMTVSSCLLFCSSRVLSHDPKFLSLVFFHAPLP